MVKQPTTKVDIPRLPETELPRQNQGEIVIKHLELIQTVINRLAQSSFLLKGWSITVVAALLTLSTRDKNGLHSLVALLPALVFWGLDSYYVRQERLFRKLYEAVASQLRGDCTPVPLLSMDTSIGSKSVSSWFRTLMSGTLWPLYGVLIIVALLVTLVNFR